MGVSIDGRPCIDPRALKAACEAARPALPTDWYGTANSYASPVGVSPGWGQLLLRKADLDALTRAEPNAARKLVFDDGANRVLLPNVRLVGQNAPRCVTPGAPDEPNAVFLVDITDRRIDCEGLSVKRYNWRSSSTASYHTNTLNGGSAWTWAALLQDLWADANLGAWPGLPAGGLADQIVALMALDTPEHIDAHGFRAADVLEECLAVHGMAVSYDPVRDTFGIEYLAGGDEVFDALVQRLRGQGVRVWDDQHYHADPPDAPTRARVLFAVWPADGASGDPRRVYARDIAAPATVAKTRANSYALVQDCRPARVDSGGSVLDAATLAARADLMARVYFDRLDPKTPADTLSVAYAGFHAGVVRHRAVDCVGWQDAGSGPVTHYVRAGRTGYSALYDYGAASPVTGSLLTTLAPTGLLKIAGAASGVRRAGGLPPGPEDARAARAGHLPGGPLTGAGDGLGPLIRRAGAIRWGTWQQAGAGGYGLWGSRLWRQWRDAITESSGGGGGSSVTVREVDGSPSVSATTIEPANATVTNPSTGVARITPHEASEAQAGIIASPASTGYGVDFGYQMLATSDPPGNTGDDCVLPTDWPGSQWLSAGIKVVEVLGVGHTVRESGSGKRVPGVFYVAEAADGSAYSSGYGDTTGLKKHELGQFYYDDANVIRKFAPDFTVEPGYGLELRVGHPYSGDPNGIVQLYGGSDPTVPEDFEYGLLGTFGAPPSGPYYGDPWKNFRWPSGTIFANGTAQTFSSGTRLRLWAAAVVSGTYGSGPGVVADRFYVRRTDGSGSVKLAAGMDGDSVNLTSCTVRGGLVVESTATGSPSPIGAVIAYGGSTAPTGWLLCNGAAVSRTTYAALFALVGTAFGAGDGSTTFNVPDYRGKDPVGAGAGSFLIKH